MRDLLLGKKVGTVRWAKGLENVMPLFSEGKFFYLIFSEKPLLTEEDLWREFNSSLFKIGIASKKSTSGAKSFLKTLITDEGTTEDLSERKPSLEERKSTHEENK